MNLSLKARLLLWAFILIPLTLIFTGVTLVERYSEQKEEEFENSAEVYLRELLALLDEKDGKAGLSGTPDYTGFISPYSKFYWQITADNVVIYHSPSLSGYVLKSPSRVPADGKIYRYPVSGPGNQPLIMIECKVNLGTVWVTVSIASDHSKVERDILHFEENVAILLFLLGAGLFVVVILQVWAGLRPLQLVHDKLRDIRNGAVSKIDGRFPVEIQPLVDELNALIINNTEVIARSRLQAANLAHGLKTPLAVMVALTNKNNGADSTHPEYATLQNQIKAIQRQVDYTLARTRIALSVDTINAHCHVNSRIEKIIHALQILYQEKNIRITCDLPSDFYVKVESQDFDEMLGNLLDNACKWSKSEVFLHFTPQPDLLAIFIEDDGPGLSPSEHEIVFARGKKLDDTVAGHGLGLPIVRDIAEFYKGRIILENSLQGGLRVKLLLPKIDIQANAA